MNNEEAKATSVEAATEEPRNPKGRYIPIDVKRKIITRSGSRCEQVLSGPKDRCRNTKNLQYHHHEPFGVGGPTSFWIIKKIVFLFL